MTDALVAAAIAAGRAEGILGIAAEALAADPLREPAVLLLMLAPRSSEGLGGAALATAYAGDADEARALNERGRAGAVSPSMRSWCAYVAGEIEGVAGRPELAERHYVRAIDLARSSGATFLVGVATVVLLTVRAAAGHVDDAMRGYSKVIDYFARTGNWTHLWATLRNLADLLRTLGDDEPAALLVAAAEHAPDAPAAGGPRPSSPGAPVLHRTEVLLDVARQAIARNLHGAVANDSAPTHAL